MEVPAPSLDASLDISLSNPETVSSHSLNTLPTVTDLVNATSNVEEFDQFQLALEDSDIGSESDHESEVEEFSQDKVKEVIDDYVACLPLDQCRMWAVILVESFQVRQSMSIKDAAQEAVSIVGFNEKTVQGGFL